MKEFEIVVNEETEIISVNDFLHFPLNIIIYLVYQTQ